MCIKVNSRYTIVFLLVIFLNFLFICDISFGRTQVEQGTFIHDNKLKLLEVGMTKAFLLDKFGGPTYTFTLGTDCCWCYYYIRIPRYSENRYIRRAVLAYFYDDYLFHFKILRY